AAAIGLTGSLRASNPYGEKKALKVKDLIWIQVNGGLSQLDTFDPKPGVAEGIRGPYKPIATRLPGVHFTELLPRLASLADKIRLIRTMHQTAPESAHADGSHRIMTGQSDAKKDHPYIGSVVARLHPATRSVPSYVWIQDTAGLDGRYRQGGAYAPFFVPAGYGCEAAYGADYEKRFGIEAVLQQPLGVSSADLGRRHQPLKQQERDTTPPERAGLG